MNYTSMSDNAERMGVEIIERIDGTHNEVKTLFDKAERRLGTVEDEIKKAEARFCEIEQKAARPRGQLSNPTLETWGQRFIASAEFKSLASSSKQRGNVALEVP